MSGTGPNPRHRRALLGILGVALLTLLVAAGLWAALRPLVARRFEAAQVRQYLSNEVHIEDRNSGLVCDLPSGWLALRAGNPYVSSPAALLRLSQPALGAFASLTMAVQPRSMDALDAFLDERLREQRPRRPTLRPLGREDVHLGRGRGRLVHTAWEDGLRPMRGATVAWADGYELFTLDAWGPVDEGFPAQVRELCRGLRSSGLVEARLGEASERLALEVPELPPDVLRLLVAERMSQGRGLEDVPREALRVVSHGLDALAPLEAAEMRTIYQKVWAPLKDADRLRMEALLREIQAGREVSATDSQALRDRVKGGVLSLPREEQVRLQELSGRAARKVSTGSPRLRREDENPPGKTGP